MPKHEQTKLLKSIFQVLRGRAGVLFSCIGLAALFWLLTALSKDYVEVIQIPVRYEHIPEDLVVVNELAGTIDAEVKIFGFDLLWYWLKLQKLEISIGADPNDLRLIKRDGERLHIYLTNVQKSKVASQFDEQFQVLRVWPDTLFFKFRSRHSKRVPVKLIATIDYDKQYGPVDEPILTPDSVTVSGLGSLVDSVKFVNTESKVFEKLAESLTVTIALQPPKNRLLKLSETEVELTLNVTEFTEGKLSVPVELIGASGKNIKVFPNMVEVTYTVPLTDYEAVQANQFHVQVDLSGTDWKKLSRLSVELGNHPSSVRQVRIHPPQVEYIIQEN